MEKKKKIILLIIIFSIIAVILVAVLFSKQKKEEEEKSAIDMNEDISNIELVEKEIYFQDYKTIKNCLQKYIDSLNINSSSYYGYNENNEYVKVIDESNIKENIYNLLSKEYINKNNITTDNVYNYVETVTENKIIIPIKINVFEQDDENTAVRRYKVSALIMSTNNKKDYSYLYLIVNIDNNNKTFSIEPVTDEKTLENTNLNYEMNEIEKYSNNTFYEVSSTQEEIALDYFSNYKNILLSDIELAYKYLDNEYKEKRFKDLSTFESYVENNIELYEKIRLEQYEIKYYDDYFQYVCIDQYGNTYIFNEKETMDYSAILDIYTIDLPQFIEAYDSSNTQEKVLLNIEKVKQAINAGDYAYIYSKLSQGFKENKFKEEQDLRNYMESELYKYVKIEYKNFTNEGETYIYNVVIKNIMNESDEEINMQIIMQLKEDRDFVMSFSII